MQAPLYPFGGPSSRSRLRSRASIAGRIVARPPRRLVRLFLRAHLGPLLLVVRVRRLRLYLVAVLVANDDAPPLRRLPLCCRALLSFRLTLADIRKPGGSESDIPKRFSALLRKDGWTETRIKGDLHITKLTGAAARGAADDGDDDETGTEVAAAVDAAADTGAGERIVRENFLDGHKVDYVKNRVAFDVEWNSKDQTFDRDLYPRQRCLGCCRGAFRCAGCRG